MRLAMIGRYYNRQGGVSRVMAELAERAAATHEVDVYAHEVLDALPGTKVRFVDTPMRERPALLALPSFARSVERRLDRSAYDVVHAHDGQTPDADVQTAHSCYAAWLDDVRRGAGLKGALSRVYPRHVMTDRWERRGLGGDAVIVAISRVVASELEQYLHIDPSRIRVIHNGVDVETFRPADSPAAARAAIPPDERAADDRVMLLFAGMYFRRKGLEPLLRGLARLRGGPWTLTVVGGDDDAPFRALAAELQIADQVHFTGHRPKIAPYFQAADAFVFPTAYEPFGLVITEALACGTPVITTATAGGAELMADGRDGFLLRDPHDPEEIAGAVQRFLDLSPEARRAMRAAARESVLATSWDEQWRKYDELFTEVAANRRAGRAPWAS
ncbi:MAG: glycosyltransferase family 4 protein [Solirubrobacteraceae bacterium]|nr:glycosyltransferase family 4 protein [Solirubrobacteraceae bacterium]